MKKKQKDYPDECPVFRIVGKWLAMDGEDGQLLGLRGDEMNRSAWPFSVQCASHLGVYKHEELRPLTPAAEDLLAAIKAELGVP